MKINYVSDVHLETYSWRSGFFPGKATGMFRNLFSCDVLVLAGDIVSSPQMLAKWLGTTSVPVVYLLGNHEYYGKTFDKTADMFRSALRELRHVHMLDAESATIGGVKFIGATLWTNFDRENPLVMEMARRSINDFRAIEGCTVNRVLERFEKESEWLEKELETNDSDPDSTVVVTHFGPSERSRHSAYPNSPVGSYFVSSLDDMIERYQPAVWIHGHTHDSCDYKIGNTRVVSNQPGYEWEYSKNRELERLVCMAEKKIQVSSLIPVLSLKVNAPPL